MLLHPCPTNVDIERTSSRCDYLLAKRVGGFRWFQQDDGSLWITRLPNPWAEPHETH
jgi:hypothetical protein